MNIANYFKTAFLQDSPVAAFAFFKKVIKQLYFKGVNFNRFLKCPCYDILIFFSSQHALGGDYMKFCVV